MIFFHIKGVIQFAAWATSALSFFRAGRTFVYADINVGSKDKGRTEDGEPSARRGRTAKD